jgi:cell wall-associated NlpC family hydrolase
MKSRIYITMIGLALTIASCSSIKTANNNSSANNDKKRIQYSEKLGIDLRKDFDMALVKEVIDWLGTPYVHGAEDKTGTDCSGFVQQVYKTVYGITTARSSSGIYDEATKVKKEKLQMGELVFFKINTEKVGHVGIFLQESYFIHASSSKGVMVSSLDLEYWTKYFVSGGKIKGWETTSN